MDFADRLRKARKRAKLTQSQLAERCDMKQQMISKLELRKAVVTAAVVRLAMECGVRPEWLAEGIEPMTHGEMALDLLTDEERKIIETYRSMCVTQRETYSRVGLDLALASKNYGRDDTNFA